MIVNFLDEEQRFTFAIFLLKGRPWRIVHWEEVLLALTSVSLPKQLQ